MAALRQALTANIRLPSATERWRAWSSFERALDRHLAARKFRPAGQRR
jgi:hypothetical protein